MGIGVEQLSNANALDVDRRAQAVLAELSKKFPPGLQYAIAFDTTTAVLMTSFAFILGVLPLVFATGAGSLGRRSVGTTIVGGMLLSTVLNLIFIPVL